MVTKVREDAVNEAYSRALERIPQEVMPSVYEAAQQQYQIANWANSNPVVMQNRELATTVLAQVDGYYPSKSIQEKLDMTLNHLNSLAGAQAPSVQKPGVQPAKPSTPAFPRAPRGSVPKPPPVDDIQKEMDEISF